MANDIEIRKIFVNKIPEGCGECPMMQYIDESPVCVALPPEVWGIEGNPYNVSIPTDKSRGFRTVRTI